METTMAVPNSPQVSASSSKGRAIGALVCGAFGAVWMLEAVYFGGIAAPALLALIVLLAAALVVWPLTRLVSFRHLPYSSAAGQSWASVSKAYWTLVAVEWLACAVAVNWLLHIHRYDLWPQLIGVIVGLHFVPLAKIFKAPVYNWTGAVMTLGALASLAIPAGHVRNLVACGVSGYSLWATALVILCQDKLSSR
jgi:hypothetical protein